jgi:Ca-activated chloride channel family protein
VPALAELLPRAFVSTAWALRHPEALYLAFLAAAAAVWIVRARNGGFAWPAFEELRAAGGRTRDHDRFVRATLRAGAILALAIAAADPVLQRPSAPPFELGLDLALVVDASGSMQALDARIEGTFRTRLELAQRVVARFARQRAVAGDRVGLVVFGDHAFTQCPLTRDGELLAASLSRVRAGVAGENTALGDALALAVKRVRARGRDATEGRVVVLLTDGRSNAGEIPVDVAAELARASGVRVHTVGIGGEGRVAMERLEGTAGRGLRFARHDLDADTLEWIAQHTGGRFFRAVRADDLEAVYRSIDALERLERPAPGRRSETPRPEPWLAFAAGFLSLELLGFSVARRTLP